MREYQIAFFDIDGTLVDHRKEAVSFTDGVPESTKQAIKKLKASGIIPVIATGRGKMAVSELAAELEINSLITSNGQEITYLGERIYHQCIEPDLIEKLFLEFNERQIGVIYETVQGIFASNNHIGMLGDKLPVQYLEQGALPENVFQMIVHTENNADIQEWLKELKVVKVAPAVANILPPEVSKASGIHLLLEKLGLPATSSLGFGDEENDMEMFGAVGTAVAMGNATEALKAKADFITKEVWNDGIYHACEVLNLFK